LTNTCTLYFNEVKYVWTGTYLIQKSKQWVRLRSTFNNISAI